MNSISNHTFIAIDDYTSINVNSIAAIKIRKRPICKLTLLYCDTSVFEVEDAYVERACVQLGLNYEYVMAKLEEE